MTLELEQATTIVGVLYTPRQVANAVGNIKKLYVETSLDGQVWTRAQLLEGNDDQTQDLDAADLQDQLIGLAPVEAKYVRITAEKTAHWQADKENSIVAAAGLKVLTLHTAESSVPVTKAYLRNVIEQIENLPAQQLTAEARTSLAAAKAILTGGDQTAIDQQVVNLTQLLAKLGESQPNAESHNGSLAEGESPALVEEKPSLEAEMVSIAYKTIERENAELPKGERRVVQEGQDGQIMNLVEVSSRERKIVDSYVQTKAVAQIIEIGTKTPKVRRKTEEHRVMYNVIERVNPDLPVGRRRTVQRGVRGLRRDVVEITAEGRRVVESTIIQAPVDKIVEIGGKEPAPKVRRKTEEHRVMYNIIERVNPDLPVGTRRTVQRGVRGLRRDVVEITAEGRRVIESTIITAPIDKIVEVGGKVTTPAPSPEQPVVDRNHTV